MKYNINYQHMPKDQARPVDQWCMVTIEVSDQNGFAVIPNVGDYVNVVAVYQDDEPFSGIVKSRLFVYKGDICTVNIVVQETDDIPWGELIEE